MLSVTRRQSTCRTAAIQHKKPHLHTYKEIRGLGKKSSIFISTR